VRGPSGALMFGTPEAVAAKMLHIDEALGGVERISVLLDGNLVAHEKVMHAIELLGSRVAPAVAAQYHWVYVVTALRQNTVR